MNVFRKIVTPLLIIPLLLGSGLSCSGERHSSGKIPVYTHKSGYPASSRRVHVVRRGETLYGVSRRYGVSVSALKSLNRIRDVRDIKIGTRLAIPARSYAKKKYKPKKRVKQARKRAPVRHVRSSMRLIWPLKKIDISSRFGIRGSRKHDGLDLRAPSGTPIYASASGSVIFSGSGPSGYGKMVIIKHDKRLITVYAHNSRNLVGKGQSVKRGQKIALVGKSGRATGYHLHFEVRINRKPVDPLQRLPKRG